MSCSKPATAASCLAPTVTGWGNSRYSEYRRCPRAHHLKFERGIRRLPIADADRDHVDYFELGRLIHACLQWAQLAPGINSWRDVVIAHLKADPAPCRFDLERAECDRLLDPYFAIYGTENAGWPDDAKIVSVEEEFTNEWELESRHLPTCRSGAGGFGCACPERLSGSYSARLDTILEIAGAITIADTKTRAKAFPQDRVEYARGLSTNPQFLGQSWLAMQRYGLEEPPPVWVNAIIKTKIPQYDRLLVRFTREAVDRWAAWQRDQSAEIGSSRAMNYSQCAPEIGSRCWAFDWCHSSPEQRARNYSEGTEHV